MTWWWCWGRGGGDMGPKKAVSISESKVQARILTAPLQILCLLKLIRRGAVHHPAHFGVIVQLGEESLRFLI